MCLVGAHVCTQSVFSSVQLVLFDLHMTSSFHILTGILIA